MEVLSAAHLAYRVTAPKEFQARGGMMFCAPPGHLKTALTKTLDLWKPQALVISDLTIRQLSDMREDISVGKITTLAFMEMQKVYARNADIANNLEGALHQMADEGFRLPNWESQDMVVKEAKALIVGAMPTNFYKRKWQDWKNSGWARRFLWCHFQLGNPEIIMDSIHHWTPIDFGKIIYAAPASGAVPFMVSEQESNLIRNILSRSKAGYDSVPFILMKKIFSVLKWRYADLGARSAAKMAQEIVVDFSECLQGVADLQIDFTFRGADGPEENPIPQRKSMKTA